MARISYRFIFFFSLPLHCLSFFELLFLEIPLSGKTKDYNIGIRCFIAANSINETAQTD
jgi:hypothetical protein